VAGTAPDGQAADGEAPETALRLSRSQRRRAGAQNLQEGAPREGVAIFRPVERAVLVAVQPDGGTAADVESSLDELELLADTAGSQVVGRVVQRRSTPDVATFVGRGKVAELKGLCASLGADAAIFDDELTPAQQRNLEERLGVQVLDRTIVILNIFAQHAQSREGKAQVELAQLIFLLPRLRGWGGALSRQGAGSGPLRGPGETQLEVDRRKLNRRITKLRNDLRDYENTRRLKAKGRERQGAPIVALVGYTNAGKSTLLNRMTGADVLVADQLFATLDPTARRLALPDGRTAVATDTVGFVRRLPTQLVEAFKSTLEETLRADLVLHVVDASHPEAEEQIRAVDEVLSGIEAENLPRLLVLNKADAADPDTLAALQRRIPGEAVVVSAVTGEGVDELVQRVTALLPPARRVTEALVPWDSADVVARVHREGEVLKREDREDGTWLLANVTPATFEAIRPYAATDPWAADRA
jgi:GTP-binding protein HflX